MALQTGGSISLSQVQGEYGGGNPISMSEYFRNGPYVPDSLGGGFTPEYYNRTGFPRAYWQDAYWGTTREVWFQGLQVATNVGYNVTSYNPGGPFTYYRGGLVEAFTTGYSGGAGQFIFSYFYGIYRSGSSVAVNQNVPTGGTIRMSNFYGGRKT
jgi:hypothetical protein